MEPFRITKEFYGDPKILEAFAPFGFVMFPWKPTVARWAERLELEERGYNLRPRIVRAPTRKDVGKFSEKDVGLLVLSRWSTILIGAL